MLDSPDTTTPKPTRLPRGKYYKGKMVKDENIVQHSEQTSTSDDCRQSSNPTNVTHSTSTTNTIKRRASIQFSAPNSDKNIKKRKCSAGSVSIAATLQVKTAAESHSFQKIRSRTSSQEMTLDPSSSPAIAQNSQCSQRRNSRPLPRKRSLVKPLTGSGDHQLPPQVLNAEPISINKPLVSPVWTDEPTQINSEPDEGDEVVRQAEFKLSTEYSSSGTRTSTEEYSERDSTRKKSDPQPAAEVGKRRALVIGIEYKDQAWFNYKPPMPGRKPTIYSMRISGSHADARDIYGLLVAQGYRPEEIRLMLDEPRTPAHDMPTHDNLKAALEKLVSGARPNDHLFVYFAGHGYQILDQEGDEDDGMDEVILPCDWSTRFNYRCDGMIKDDFLRQNYIDRLPAGCQLIGVFDSCHSGTIFDLPECYPKEKYDSVLAQVQYRTPRNPHKPVAARVMCFSACMDSQRAYESTPSGSSKTKKRESRGRFTQAFTQTITEFKWANSRNPTVKELFQGIVDKLPQLPNDKNGQPRNQDPLLTTSSDMAPEMKQPIVF